MAERETGGCMNPPTAALTEPATQHYWMTVTMCGCWLEEVRMAARVFCRQVEPVEPPHETTTNQQEAAAASTRKRAREAEWAERTQARLEGDEVEEEERADAEQSQQRHHVRVVPHEQLAEVVPVEKRRVACRTAALRIMDPHREQATAEKGRPQRRATVDTVLERKCG